MIQGHSRYAATVDGAGVTQLFQDRNRYRGSSATQAVQNDIAILFEPGQDTNILLDFFERNIDRAFNVRTREFLW